MMGATDALGHTSFTYNLLNFFCIFTVILVSHVGTKPAFWRMSRAKREERQPLGGPRWPVPDADGCRYQKHGISRHADLVRLVLSLAELA